MQIQMNNVSFPHEKNTHGSQIYFRCIFHPQDSRMHYCKEFISESSVFNKWSSILFYALILTHNLIAALNNAFIHSVRASQSHLGFRSRGVFARVFARNALAFVRDYSDATRMHALCHSKIYLMHIFPCTYSQILYRLCRLCI